MKWELVLEIQIYLRHTFDWKENCNYLVRIVISRVFVELNILINGRKHIGDSDSYLISVSRP